ncbi:sialidase family protein [Rubinisphaera margarita]|uniref:sialidase family protein n=1 Tax=Rubinisphaera margarita TaxID=2909586 RepID=UPI001EE803B9|nr:sialidase family protein [Rubinisphaera margarita]MCG6156513.1 glycoside hydrolase [Rubinisphaera margarita]
MQNRSETSFGRVTRRTFLGTSVAGTVSLINPLPSRAGEPCSPRDIKTITTGPKGYCGWPTVTRRTNGELIVVWSGDRGGHVCPFGAVQMMRSNDNGETWTWPRTILDGAIDDRDAGILETSRGTLLVTTFTSLAYEPLLNAELERISEKKNKKKNKTNAEEQELEQDDDEKEKKKVKPWPKKRLKQWMAAHNRLSDEQRQQELGEWMIRSTDGGLTWSERYPTIVNSPHGPIELSDGRLLYAGKELWNGSKRIGVCVSEDDGLSWSWLAEIPTRSGDDPGAYHELHAVEATDGRIIVHIRNHNKVDASATLQSESSDGGQTWSEPKAIGVWGFPSFLTRLRDGRLLMSYGYRRKPYGNLARVSTDCGHSWCEPITISDDGPGGDLGYPSTVELDDGTLLTVWYEGIGNGHHAVLRQARWTLDA